MKKFIIWLSVASLVLSVFLQTACSSVSSSASSWEETSSGIVNTEFTREKVIAENIVSSDSDSFAATRLWACQFVEKNYQTAAPSEVRAQFVTGFSVQKADIADVGVGASVYDVSFRTEKKIGALSAAEDGSYTIRLQVVFTVADSGLCTLSGFAFEDALINDARQLYEYLKGDSRVALREYPVPSTGEGVTGLNLTEMLSGRNVQLLSSVYPLGKDRLFFLSRDRNAADGTVDVNFYDCTSNQNFADNEAMHLSGVSVYYTELSEDSVTVVYNYVVGGAYYTNTFDFSGAVKGKMLPLEQTNKYYLNRSTCILSEAGSLYLLDEDTGERTPLLQSSGEGEENTGYVFSGVVDSHTFLYTQHGYEWVLGCGVYDVKTMTATTVAEGGTAAGYYDGKVYYYQGESEKTGLYAAELENLTAVPQTVVAEGIYNAAFSPDGKYFAYYSESSIESYPSVSVSIVDLTNGQTVPGPTVQYVMAVSGLYFVDDSTLVMLSTESAIFDRWVYTFTIQ